MKPHKSISHFPFPFLVVLVLLPPPPTSATPPPTSSSSYTDAQQLLSFKSSLPIPTLLPNWLPNQNPCSFSGIFCNGTRISSIDLSSVSLATNLTVVSNFLMALDSLESLSLKSVSLSGSISLHFPPGSKCSPLLTSLDLAHNSLSGPLSDVPNFAAACSALTFLNLSSNSLDFSTIPSSSAFPLRTLQVLDLSYNKITGPNVVPWILSDGCGNLQRLVLKGNKISGDMSVVSTCSKLEHLDLSSNNFSISLPSFGDCSALDHLDISGNKFSGDVGRAISSCKQLTFLNLSMNHFNGPIPVMPTNSLKFLSLGGNGFQGIIPMSLMDSCAELVELDLSANSLSGSVPDALSSCSLLEPGTHDSWGPQIQGLTGSVAPNDDERTSAADCCGNEAGFSGGDIEVCAFDNRGMGRSSIPTKKSEYITRTMAKDAIALMDHLGWTEAHVFGHSMGAMIACKLAAMVPDRILSLALLNVTGGGFECLPRLDRQTLSIAVRFLKAKTPEQRAAVDLDTHYSKGYLEEYVGSNTRRAMLYQEYVKGISATGMQSNHGFEGQINACWTHKMTRKEIELIRSAGFLVSVIHGRHDVVAQIYYARRLAEKLHPVARMVDLPGGHLVSHERTEEVNKALMELIKATEAKTEPHDWTNLPETSSGWMVTRISRIRKSSAEGRSVSFTPSISERLHLFLFGLFSLALENGRRALRTIKPARVGHAIA